MLLQLLQTMVMVKHIAMTSYQRGSCFCGIYSESSLWTDVVEELLSSGMVVSCNISSHTSFQLKLTGLANS